MERGSRGRGRGGQGGRGGTGGRGAGRGGRPSASRGSSGSGSRSSNFPNREMEIKSNSTRGVGGSGRGGGKGRGAQRGGGGRGGKDVGITKSRDHGDATRPTKMIKSGGEAKHVAKKMRKTKEAQPQKPVGRKRDEDDDDDDEEENDDEVEGLGMDEEEDEQVGRLGNEDEEDEEDEDENEDDGEDDVDAELSKIEEEDDEKGIDDGLVQRLIARTERELTKKSKGQQQPQQSVGKGKGKGNDEKGKGKGKEKEEEWMRSLESEKPSGKGVKDEQLRSELQRFFRFAGFGKEDARLLRKMSGAEGEADADDDDEDDEDDDTKGDDDEDEGGASQVDEDESDEEGDGQGDEDGDGGDGEEDETKEGDEEDEDEDEVDQDSDDEGEADLAVEGTSSEVAAGQEEEDGDDDEGEGEGVSGMDVEGGLENVQQDYDDDDNEDGDEVDHEDDDEGDEEDEEEETEKGKKVIDRRGEEPAMTSMATTKTKTKVDKATPIVDHKKNSSKKTQQGSTSTSTSSTAVDERAGKRGEEKQAAVVDEAKARNFRSMMSAFEDALVRAGDLLSIDEDGEAAKRIARGLKAEQVGKLVEGLSRCGFKAVKAIESAVDLKQKLQSATNAPDPYPSGPAPPDMLDILLEDMKVRDEEAGLEEGEEGYIQVGLWKRVTRENQRTWSVMEPYFGEEIAADDELDELVGEDEEEAEGDDAADKEDVEQSDKQKETDKSDQESSSQQQADQAAPSTRPQKGLLKIQKSMEDKTREIYMRQLTECFADDLDELKTKEHLEASQLPQLINALEVGFELYSEIEKDLTLHDYKTQKRRANKKKVLTAQEQDLRSRPFY